MHALPLMVAFSAGEQKPFRVAMQEDWAIAGLFIKVAPDLNASEVN